MVRAIVISNNNGVPLVSLKIDPSLDEISLSPLLSAIKIFSTQVLGQEPELSFKTGNSELYCFHKNYHVDLELMIFALMDTNMKQLEIKEEAESTLDSFVQFYGINLLIDWNGDTSIFIEFQQKLQDQIDLYYTKIQRLDETNRNQNETGFFSKITKIISKFLKFT